MLAPADDDDSGDDDDDVDNGGFHPFIIYYDFMNIDNDNEKKRVATIYNLLQYNKYEKKRAATRQRPAGVGAHVKAMEAAGSITIREASLRKNHKSMGISCTGGGGHTSYLSATTWV